MELGEIIDLIIQNTKAVTVIAAILSVVVQVSPIKINPWSSIFNWIGGMLNRDLLYEIKDVQKDLKSLGDRVDENEIDRLRREILDFGNSCRNGRKHCQEEFEQIIKWNQKYHSILDRIGEKNGVLDSMYLYIEKTYQECLDKNDFI